MQHERTILQLVHIDETGDSYYRMRWPARELACQQPNWRIINLDARAEERFELAEQADLLVLYQCGDYDLAPVIEKRRAAGRKTLAEYNDNFYASPPSTPVADVWSSPLVWQGYETMMQMADILLVTGEGLRELFSKRFTKEIAVLENHLPEAPPPFEAVWREPEGDRIILGWGGSIGHAPDLLAALPLLRRVLERFPEAHLKIMGNVSLPSYLRIPEERFTFVPWGTVREYYRFWDDVQIGVAPLLDSPYNRCRSDVKALEMSAHGVLPVVAKLSPYDRFLSKAATPSYSSFSELESILASLLKEPHSLRQKTNVAYDYVVRERVGTERTERAELYERMMPVPPSMYSWSLPVGCHELSGTPSSVSATHHVLRRAQEEWSSGRREDARETVERARIENEKDPEVAVSRIKVMKALSDPAWHEAVSAARVEFPRDIRFWLIEIEGEEDSGGRVAQWTKLLDELAASEPAVQRFYEGAVCTSMIAMFVKDYTLRGVVERLVDLYPHQLELRSKVAAIYEAANDDTKALTHFTAAAEIAERVTQNADAMKRESIPVLRTWVAALEGRLRG